MICTECKNGYVVAHIIEGVCPECYDMNYNNGGHGFAELEEHQGEDFHDEFYDDENDDILEQQERDDFDETDEAYGRYSDADYDEPYDNDRDFGING